MRKRPEHLKCPDCGSTYIIKNGKRKIKGGGTRQKYLCKDCLKIFTAEKIEVIEPIEIKCPKCKEKGKITNEIEIKKAKKRGRAFCPRCRYIFHVETEREILKTEKTKPLKELLGLVKSSLKTKENLKTKTYYE